MAEYNSDDDIFITQSTFKENSEPDFALKSSLYSDISSDSEADNDLITATQKAEQMYAKENVNPLRFQTVTDDAIEELLVASSSKKTFAKTMWAVRLFDSWKSDRNKKAESMPGIKKVEGELLFMSDQDVNFYLSRFITEIRKQNGEEYRGNTLYEIVSSLQHYLRDKNRNINFFENDNFSELRKVLDAKMKVLARQGVGIHKRQAAVITCDQENVMWERHILGTDSPQKLLDTLLYTLGLNFALRAGMEHRSLRVGLNSQLSVCQGEGRRYLLYTEDVSKTNAGGINQRKLSPKTTRAYEMPQQPERCPVQIFQKYMSLRPKEGNCTALYLRPLKYPKTDCWYPDSPVGVNLLSQTIKKICQAAGFDGFFTNHSLRATAATRLFEAGIDEQLISEKTGHRSTAIRSYKRVSEQQLENLSDILQPVNISAKECTITEQSVNVQGPVGTSGSSSREINIKSGDLDISVKF